MEGFLLFDKPIGVSSAKAVALVKRVGGFQKIGHSGTLDPLASGVLLLGVESSGTRMLHFLVKEKKVYRARVRLGVETDSGDAEGKLTKRMAFEKPEEGILKELFGRFQKHYREQIPPMYSALKHKGQPLYRLARQNKNVERKPRGVVLYHFRLQALYEDGFDFEVGCSAGTYIRTLCEDLAKALGSVGYLVALRRISIGRYSVDDAFDEDWLKRKGRTALQSRIILLESGIPPSMPRVFIGRAAAVDFSHGRPSFLEDDKMVLSRNSGELSGVALTSAGNDDFDKLVAVFDGAGLVGIGRRASNSQTLEPVRVFRQAR